MIRNLDNVSGKILTYPRVLALEKTKSTQALEITSLKRRVKKLEKKQRSRTHKLKRLYKVGLTVRVDSFKDEPSLGEDRCLLKKKLLIKSAAGEANAASIATTVNATVTTKEITLAQALVEIKTLKPKAKGIVLQEPSESPTITTTMPKKITKHGLAREKTQKEQKANIALIETWDGVQAKIDADYQMAKRLVKTASESYYYQYKEVTTAQVEVSAAQEL
nr:hypothetical protein [Tanacetum cinerariifolium]